jgi:hypothetical protein
LILAALQQLEGWIKAGLKAASGYLLPADALGHQAGARSANW